MDFIMPNLDGPTATVEIRRLGFTGLLVGLTGQLHTEDIEVFLKSGADKVLGKPLQTDLLRMALETFAIHKATEKRTA